MSRPRRPSRGRCPTATFTTSARCGRRLTGGGFIVQRVGQSCWATVCASVGVELGELAVVTSDVCRRVTCQWSARRVRLQPHTLALRPQHAGRHAHSFGRRHEPKAPAPLYQEEVPDGAEHRRLLQGADRARRSCQACHTCSGATAGAPAASLPRDARRRACCAAVAHAHPRDTHPPAWCPLRPLGRRWRRWAPAHTT